MIIARVYAYAANFLKSYVAAYGAKFLERLLLRWQRQNFLYAFTSLYFVLVHLNLIKNRLLTPCGKFRCVSEGWENVLVAHKCVSSAKMLLYVYRFSASGEENVLVVSQICVSSTKNYCCKNVLVVLVNVLVLVTMC